MRKVLKLPQGDRRHFKKKDVTEVHINNVKADERYLHIPLVLAERNWAYAMQLRQEANTEPRKKFNLIQKLRKACVYALQLEELCKVSFIYFGIKLIFLMSFFGYKIMYHSLICCVKQFNRKSILIHNFLEYFIKQ